MVDLSLVRLADLWYVVGLLATDGNLSKDGRHILITSKDCDHLLAVRSALKLNVKLGKKSRGYSKEKKYGVLQFGDVAFYRFLQDVGLTQKKSLTLGPIKVPDKYFRDFLRGVIDGDGNIQRTIHKSNRNVQWNLRLVSGSSIFLPWIQKMIQRSVNIQGKLYIRPAHKGRNPLYILKYGKFAAKVILRECYYPNALAMKRKLKSSIECLQSEDRLSKYGQFVST